LAAKARRREPFQARPELRPLVPLDGGRFATSDLASRAKSSSWISAWAEVRLRSKRAEASAAAASPFALSRLRGQSAGGFAANLLAASRPI
jgi:hypothetical protein